MPDDFANNPLPGPHPPAPIADAAVLPPARLLEWKPWVHSPNNRLIGHATIGFASGLTISRIPVFRDRHGGGVAVGAPSAPEINAEGRVRMRPEGGRVYTPIVGFSSAAAKQRWQRVVLATLTAAGIAL